MAKKKPKKKLVSGMVFHTLTLNEQDLEHLRWVLVTYAEWQKDIMEMPPTKGQAILARDFMVDAMKIIQMIDKVCPKLKEDDDGY